MNYTLLIAVPWNGLEHVRKKGYMTVYIKKWWFDVSFLTSICVNKYLETEKIWIFKKINVINIVFIGFVKFKTKEDQFCVWFILAQLHTAWDCLSIFSKPFSKRETDFSYFFLLLIPVQCLEKTFFCTLSLPSHIKQSQNSLPF